MSMEYARLLEKDKKTPIVRYKAYTDGMTKQSFKDQCDVNKILKRHGIKSAASHAVNYPPEYYQEFAGVDLLEAHQLVDKARQVFADLPSEVRQEFSQDPFRFAAFASDPANNAKLAELLPAIAEPGTWFPNPVARGGTGAGMATPPQTEPPAPPADSGDTSAAEPASGVGDSA